MSRRNERSNKYSSWITCLSQLEKLLAIAMLSVILVTMSAQVIARYIFNSPFSWSEELARFAMIWLTFISAAWVTSEGGHIKVDLWGMRVSRQFSRWMDGFIHLLVAASCIFLMVGGLRFVWYVHPVASPSLGIPKSLWYGAVSVGLGLMAVHHLLRLFVNKER